MCFSGLLGVSVFLKVSVFFNAEAFLTGAFSYPSSFLSVSRGPVVLLDDAAGRGEE